MRSLSTDEHGGIRHRSMGDHIRRRRKELGLTLQEVAERCGLSAPFICQIERGIRVPSLLSLLRLVRSLEADLTDVVPGASLVYSKISAQYRLMRIPAEYILQTDQREAQNVRLYLIEGGLQSSEQTPPIVDAARAVHADSRSRRTARSNSSEEAVLLHVAASNGTAKPPGCAAGKGRRK